jgi:hypothetical protein
VVFKEDKRKIEVRIKGQSIVEYKFGGYEPSVSPYIPTADKALKEVVLGYLKGELKGR